ncbi:cell wall-binding repeat-containing protein [Clostridium sp. P21]|uniref:Cell wall-binding repeat-containing protein n=1 Tax=Clostridium muellerianum TaxID=2716538 RepID=A0A7Y0HMP6_9CLOT|nr:cell wall-binding repeat-containing protein [Clostridium muellerianum]NMM61186.1 cell wall-binding repeat-containing protein [Clostridium muellerianum]
MNKQKIKMKNILLGLTLTSIFTIGTTLVYNNNVYASDPITINRISGQDRFETSVKLSQYWRQYSDYAVLVNSEDYPDAVAVAPLARKFEAPILLTNKDSIPNVIKSELQRLKVRKVFIIGGTGVISKNVENELSNLGITVEERIAGQDRFETSTKIAHHLVSRKNDVYVVENENWQDALAISPVASYYNAPIILVDKDNGVANTIKQNICNEFHTYLLVGEKYHQDFRNQAEKGLGEGTGNGIAVNVLGNTKEDTNIEIYNTFKDTGNIETDGALKLDRVYLVSNEGLADALSLSTIAGQDRSMILFVNKDYYGTAKKFLTENASKIKDIEVVGGTGILPQNVVDDLYNSMTNTKATQDAQAKAQYEKDWNDRNAVVFTTPDKYVEPPITFLEGSKILGAYLNVDYNKVYGEDGQMGVNMLGFNDLTLTDGRNLASVTHAHMCTAVETGLVNGKFNYILLLDRNSGNLYEKVDRNNPNAKEFKLVKNVLGKPPVVPKTSDKLTSQLSLKQSDELMRQYLSEGDHEWGGIKAYEKYGYIYIDGVYENYIVEDGTNLLGHNCLVSHGEGVGHELSPCSYILDRGTGNLYVKVDKSNKGSKVYKFVKNLLAK